MIYSTGSHTKFYHRFHVVWTTKYRYKVMRGEMRERIREIIIQTCHELGVHIEKGVLSTDHVHMFISVPPQIALSKVMMRIKGRSSYKIQREFPELRKRYWGQRFWARGFFSTTSGNVTDAVILQYLELHSKREPTGVSRQSFSYAILKCFQKLSQSNGQPLEHKSLITSSSSQTKIFGFLSNCGIVRKILF